MPLLALMLLTSLSPGPASDLPPLAPPVYADTAHVLNGCHISSLVYLARFLAAFPQKKASPLLVTIRNADGVTRPHTIALLTWRGQWWGRDEYFGVFPLGLAAGRGVVTDTVAREAERALDQHSDLIAADRTRKLPGLAPARLSVARRGQEVALARKLLPLPARQFWVRCGDAEIPLLFFRPAPGCIAVYDPLHGTATAEVDCADDAAIVAAVARRMGYAVASIRAEPQPEDAASPS